jgi:hypothetical protein
MMRSQHRTKNVYVDVPTPTDMAEGEGYKSFTLPGGTTWVSSFSNYTPIESISAPVSTAADGVYAFHLSRYKNILDNYRTELKGTVIGLTKEMLFGTQYTTSFRLHVPPDWVADDLHEIIWQLHQAPDAAEVGFDSSPLLSLQVINNQFMVSYKYSTDPISYSGFNQVGLNSGFFGAITANSAYDIEISFNLSRGTVLPAGNLTIKLNTVVQHTYTGPIGYDDLVGPFMKFGIYKAEWKKEHDNPVDTTERRYGFSSMTIVTA